MSRILADVRTGIVFGVVLAAGALLSACGGGGGGGGGGDAYSISTNSVTFTANQGGPTPAAKIVTVSVNAGTVFIDLTQSGTGFTAAFQITGATTGEVRVTPDAPTNAGTFTGTITVRGCSTINCVGPDVAGSPKTISVTYTVSPPPTVTPSPTTISFLVGSGTTPGPRNLAISSSAGTAPWTSQVTYTSGTPGWLSLTPSAGTLPTTVALNATSMLVGTYKASITLTVGTGSATVLVSLAVNALGANFVAPYVATTNVAGDAIIRGYGFSGLTGPQVLFDATPATAVTAVSDTEIRATYPALAAGTYPIAVKDGTQTLASRAQLVVVDPPVFPAVAIVRPSPMSFATSLIYDAERKAAYLIDSDNDRVERYRYNGVSWDATSLPGPGGIISGNRRLALAPDGTEILKTNFNSISRINPATLALISEVDAVPFLGLGGASLGLIASANDGGAIGGASSPNSGISLYRYDMLTHEFAALSTQFDMVNRLMVGSGDGSRLILPSFEYLLPSSAKPVFTFNASDGTLAASSLNAINIGQASQSRVASRAILTTAAFTGSQATTVYDSSFAVLGTLPATLTSVVISPDGATAYAFFSGAPGTVRKFDLNSPNGGGFTEIGSGTSVPDSPGTNYVEMAISPDGGSLFLAGNQKVIVMPAP